MDTNATPPFILTGPGWHLEQADVLDFLDRQPANSAALVIGSPPYLDARENVPGAPREPLVWVDWMLRVTAAAVRVSTGLVVWVAAGVQRRHCYLPVCEGLAWEWWKRHGDLWRPAIWHKNGLFGTGGKQGLRNDWEFCLLFKRAGALPWADNTACGRPPRYREGGPPSHRIKSGQRRPPRTRPYKAPRLANPGNVIYATVGGGHESDPEHYENEAPFPTALARFWILSYAPPGGLVIDPFVGSGTSAVVACTHGRLFRGCDLRREQVELAHRRLSRHAARVPA